MNTIVTESADRKSLCEKMIALLYRHHDEQENKTIYFPDGSIEFTFDHIKGESRGAGFWVVCRSDLLDEKNQYHFIFMTEDEFGNEESSRHFTINIDLSSNRTNGLIVNMDNREVVLCHKGKIKGINGKEISSYDSFYSLPVYHNKSHIDARRVASLTGNESSFITDLKKYIDHVFASKYN